MRHSIWRVLVLLLILAGFGLRIYRLGALSLWYDETVSVALAQLPVAQMIARTAGDIHPPGYYLLLHFWQVLTQPTPAATGSGSVQPLEFLYAFPSLWASVLTLSLLVPVGKRLVGKPAALIGLALAAASPFAVWYAQEVRMYALAGLLGLLCLWATLRALETGKVRWLLLYVFAAAAGLWSLYYFLFLLAGLAAAAALLAPTWRRFGAWCAAQVGVLILFAPWLPTLWRQATDPPVPPWRPPIGSLADLVRIKFEAHAAPLVGQVEIGPLWVWGLATLLLTAGCLVAGSGSARRRVALVLAVLLPTWLLITISWLGPPLYFVRYLYPWSVGFPLIAGGGVAALAGRRPAVRQWLFGAVLGGLLAMSVVALRAFWTDARYREADHRGAVSALAQVWRPGDAILVNAGWVWPPLTVYWPDSSPPLAAPVRLLDVAGGAPLPAADFAGPLSVPIVRSGSIDGSPSLGWGNPSSDFFAISPQETVAGLETLAHTYARIWHYRMFDTVNDPGGEIRTWLEETGSLAFDGAIAGEDLGRLQLYVLGAGEGAEAAPSQAAWSAEEGGPPILRLLSAQSTAVEAGRLVYAEVTVLPETRLATLGATLSSSLRLFTESGEQIAQTDESPQPPSATWTPGRPVTLRLAVAAPNPLPDGPLHLDLILYRQDTLAPLPVAGPSAVDGLRLRLR